MNGPAFVVIDLDASCGDADCGFTLHVSCPVDGPLGEVGETADTHKYEARHLTSVETGSRKKRPISRLNSSTRAIM